MKFRFITLRSLVSSLAGAMPAITLAAQAHAYPVKPVEIVVPYPPGASTDLIARILQPSLSAELKQTVVIENRSGASGDIGAVSVAKAPADGYRLLFGASPITITPHVSKGGTFNPVRDLTPVAKIANGPMGIAVRADMPVKNLAELVALAKKEPNKLSFGSAGNGSIHHLIGELLNQRAGIQIQHVPYRGIGPALTDLLGGNIQVVISTLAGLKPMMDAGKVKILAISDGKRFEGMPNIPTVAELYPGFDASTWFGIYAPANTPPDIIKKLNSAINTAIASPKVNSQLIKNLLSPSTGSPEWFGELTRADYARWGQLVKDRNIQGD